MRYAANGFEPGLISSPALAGGHESFGSIGAATPALRRWRAILPLLLLAALAASVVVTWLALGHSDENDLRRQHVALREVLGDRSASSLTAAEISDAGKIAGLANLRLETDPETDRNMQVVLDPQGRITGWLSWDRQRSMTDLVDRVEGMLQVMAGLFVAFAASALGGMFRARRAAARSLQAKRAAETRDRLTGLPNRDAVVVMLADALKMRSSDRSVALLLLDLEGFKDVRETIGIEGGDELLTAVAKRLVEIVPPRSIVARFGDDDFAVVTSVEHVKDAAETATSLVQAMAKPFWIAGQAIQIEASVGLSQAPGDADTANELIRRAELALRSAMRRGRGVVLGFDARIETEQHDRHFVLKELKRALAEDLLDVHYQPIVAADGQNIVGAEALLRWRHPVRGDIPPSVFIPVAEHSGLMIALGEFVLRRALTDAMRWPHIYVAVNLSPIQVRNRALVTRVAAIIAEVGIAPSRVVLEVTEGVLIDNPDEAKERLSQLRGLGARIALDDFGSGYSSLSYLRRFPIDKLKIDKEFVAPLGSSTNGGVIVQAIVALGRSLGLSVLAEGVETEEQRILLRLAGCGEMQGFLFARPGPSSAMDALLKMDEPKPAGYVEVLPPLRSGSQLNS